MVKNNIYMKIDIIGNIYIKDMIIYYDKPLVFSCINDFQQYFIACCNELDCIEEWFFLPISEARLIKGLKGNISAYDLFKYPEGEFLWKIKIDSNNYSNGRATQIKPELLCDEDLPDKDIVYDIYGEEDFTLKNSEREGILNDSVLERREIFDISLEPKDSHVHEIDALVLGKVLESTQNIINLIAHKQGVNAKVPNIIKEENKLNVAGNYAASFGIRLKSNMLADILNESEIQKNLDIFMNILDAKSDTDKLTEILKELNPAVSIYYIELLKLLSKEEIGIKTYCAFPNNKYRKNHFVSEEIVLSLKSLEENIKELSKEIHLKGSVVAIDTLNRTFKFIAYDGEKVNGVIGEKINVEEYVLPKKAKIKLEMVTKLNDLTGKENINYRLLELEYI